MNKGPIFFLILLGLGIFLWFQQDEIALKQSGSVATATTVDTPPLQGTERFVIREKFKPGGYIGWHTTERDEMTHRARQTRQASAYYLVCTETGSGTRRTFLVDSSTYHMERIGNVLSADQVRRFREVTDIEEPSLKPGFEFRRRSD